jgi:hypothetical protein
VAYKGPVFRLGEASSTRVLAARTSEVVACEKELNFHGPWIKKKFITQIIPERDASIIPDLELASPCGKRMNRQRKN